MRKTSYFLILCAVLAISSCSKSEILSEEESKEQVNVSFLAQPDVIVTAGTRAAATDLIDAKKFSFYAFKRNKDGKTYSFTKEISDTSEGAKYNGSEWSSNLSQLPVGTYSFLCLYNVGAAQSLSGIEGVKNMEWSAIQNGIIIEHRSKLADVDEFFSGEVTDVAITGSNGNSIVVDFGELKRVSARIDVKFVKVTADKLNEVSYKEGKTIFGDAGNLQSIKQTVKGLANTFSFGEMNQVLWEEKCEFKFGSNLVTLGTSAINSTFPAENDEKDMNNTANMENGIIRGGAYFRGAYVLPFMAKEAKLDEVLIYLIGKSGADEEEVDRTITVTNGNGIELFVKKNFITLITVKLLSTTATGPGDGDDNEHLFNPKMKFTVSVDSKYDGVNNSDVVVE